MSRQIGIMLLILVAAMAYAIGVRAAATTWVPSPAGSACSGTGHTARCMDGTNMACPATGPTCPTTHPTCACYCSTSRAGKSTWIRCENGSGLAPTPTPTPRPRPNPPRGSAAAPVDHDDVDVPTDYYCSGGEAQIKGDTQFCSDSTATACSGLEACGCMATIDGAENVCAPAQTVNSEDWIDVIDGGIDVW